MVCNRVNYARIISRHVGEVGRGAEINLGRSCCWHVLVLADIFFFYLLPGILGFENLEMSLSFEIRYLWIDLIFQRFIMFLKSLTCGLFENIPVMPRYHIPRKHVYLSCVMKICLGNKTLKFRIIWWNE